MVMDVIDYAANNQPPAFGWRRFLLAAAMFASVMVCLIASHPAISTAMWLQRAHQFKLDPAVIQETEQFQKVNVTNAADTWLIAVAGWAIYFRCRRYFMTSQR
jgi:hypothetical protein